MLKIPIPIQKSFDDLLAEQSIPVKYRPYYHKWLRYYLDFCRKYNLSDKSRSSVTPFLDKLRECQQLNFQINQANHAVSLYYQLISRESESSSENQKRSGSNQAINSSNIEGGAPSDHSVKPRPAENHSEPHKNDTASNDSNQVRRQSSKSSDYVPRHHSRDGDDKTAETFHRNGPSQWDQAQSRLAEIIQDKHYSPKTLKSYSGWVTNLRVPSSLAADNFFVDM